MANELELSLSYHPKFRYGDPNTKKGGVDMRKTGVSMILRNFENAQSTQAQSTHAVRKKAAPCVCMIEINGNITLISSAYERILQTRLSTYARMMRSPHLLEHEIPNLQNNQKACSHGAQAGNGNYIFLMLTRQGRRTTCSDFVGRGGTLR